MSLPTDKNGTRIAQGVNCTRGVVGVAERDGALLIIQRAPALRAGGMWCFPGGHIEAGESPADAIVREFQEEVGLRVVAERRLWSWLRDDGGLHLEWWGVRVTGGVLKPDPAEVAVARWMTDDEIRRQPDMIEHNITFLDLYRSGKL